MWGEVKPRKIIPVGLDPTVPRVRANPDFELDGFFNRRTFCLKLAEV